MKMAFIRLALVAASGLVALLILEGTLRLSGIAGGQDRLSFYEFDQELGWVTKKSEKLYRSTGVYAHFTYYNPDGFPTDQLNWDVPLSREAPSVAIVGDSFPEGYYLPYEQTFPYLLDQKLQDIQVINAGVSGYSPDQYLLLSRRVLGDYNVDTIIVTLFSGNDMEFISSDTMQGYAKPVFNGSFEKPVNTPLVNSTDAIDDDGDGLFQGIENVADKTATFKVMKPILGNLRQLVGIDGTFVQEPTLHDEAEMNKALRLINQINTEFPVENFLVYYIPVMEEVESEEILKHNLALYHKTCEEIGMKCYSPERVLNGANAREVYTPGEGHFSQYGSGLIADDIYGILTGGASN